MIYRTLHTYILRELLRVFLLTASALTTLMAFGGMFRPLTKQGIDVRQVMVILVNLMPAMLAYAIPIAALFAAVLVYWRMSTDNELTACRAGGISFRTIVMPAFLLGLAVASIDLGFVNYVVPQFLRSTERAVLRDLGSLIVSQVNRQERFQYERLMVTADEAVELPSNEPDVSIVELKGLAATYLDAQGKPVATVVGQKARITIHNLAGQDAAEIEISLENTVGFSPQNAFAKAEGSAKTITPDGKPFRVPSYFKSKTKFLNWPDLMELNGNPYKFPTVSEITDKIQTEREYEDISVNMLNWWRRENATGKVTFMQAGMRRADGSPSQDNQIDLYAAQAAISPTGPAQESLTFAGAAAAATGPAPAAATAPAAGRVRVEERVKGALSSVYTADAADVVLGVDQYTGSGVNAGLRLHGHVMQEMHGLNGVTAKEADTTVVSGLILPEELRQVRVYDDSNAGDMKALVGSIDGNLRKNLVELRNTANLRIEKLYQTIDSELHSRGSFAVSCLTLVLLGAALGILMRGRNPLAVFIVGSVPAVILVLLITAGRQLTEGNPHNKTFGLMVIWAGNGLLLLIVAAVYAKLLRR